MVCHCKKKSASESSPKEQATEEIDTKNDLTGKGEDKNDTLNKSIFMLLVNLEKEFIFQASMTFQSPATEFSSVKSRIVSFKKDGNSLLMLESSQGNSVEGSTQQGILLAKFALVEEKEDGIHFDFNEGMSQLFLMGDLFAEDIQGKEFNAGDKWSSLEFNESWVSSVNNNSDYKQYIIVQKGQLKSRDLSGLNRLFPITVDYNLRLYKPNPSFRAVRSLAKNHVGFFEVSPQLREGGGDTILYSSKFHIDESKPIIYQISSNTPSEYIEAIKNGVLYWNRVFGKEVLKISSQNESSDNHLIQWVDWKNASYAYADMSMDPRIGEILKAKVFLTSAFAFDAKVQARMFLANLEDSDPLAFELNSLADYDYSKLKTPDQFDKVQQEISKNIDDLFDEGKQLNIKNASQSLSIRGFSPIKYCTMHYGAKQFAHYLAASEHSHLTEQHILRISQGMITAVVAHEVGHNLGLRHNFAGSLGTSYGSEEFATEYESYVSDDKIFSKVLTNTVMDYPTSKNSSALGSYIRKGGGALSYDKKAIGVLYQGNALVEDDNNYFCTDTHLELYSDCDVFDSGDSVFSRTKWAEKKAIDGMPVLLAEIFSRCSEM
ncbi:MAG: zinc-dependent metalloprotease [Oligoflexales bacterium]|nr:zinc-dependent metalloprotease [Oligoflexales bacterium]